MAFHSSAPPRLGGLILLVCLLLQTLLVVTAASSATFDLYDNGASTGGATYTLDESNFPVGEDEDHSGELFATQMSQLGLVNVTKYGQKPGTVRAAKAFREDGERIVSFEQLLPSTSGNRRVYLVAEDLEFVWPFIQYGHRQIVSPRALLTVEADDGKADVIVESVSDSPRVFKIYNLFSRAESQALIDTALGFTGDKRLKRSTVGNQKGAENEGAQIDHGRTSENAWDHESPAAKIMIERSFNLTGIHLDAGKVDGLQIVRYMPGEFYNTHPDYFGRSSDPDFDFNPYSGGSNRFATVFMYINDVEEGGNTVFPRAQSPDPSEPTEEAKAMFKSGSLERSLLDDCHHKLAVPPQQGTAALFYSITPDGRVDPNSYHGACPVIKGVKWGANIWIWNRQRYGDIKTGDKRVMTVVNEMDEPVYITWESKDNGEMLPGEYIKFDTFEYHRFKAQIKSYKGETVSEFTVQSEPQEQTWTIQPERKLGYNMDGAGLNKEIPSRGTVGAHSEL